MHTTAKAIKIDIALERRNLLRNLDGKRKRYRKEDMG